MARRMLIRLVGFLAVVAVAAAWTAGNRPLVGGRLVANNEMNQTNCKLSVPANPLTAQGLATPWVLSGADEQAAGCEQTNANARAFVQAAILSPDGALRMYDPLVITRGTQPAAAPTVPSLPAGSVVGLWVGFNGNVLRLVGPGTQQGNCVNGVPGSPFGQMSFCNTGQFFAAANQAVKAGKLTIPALGTARDGRPCPTTRDFSVVDQDQSDNVTTMYLLTPDGRTAQNTPQNQAALRKTTAIANGSDNRLLSSFIDPALGCQPFSVTNATDPTGRSTEAGQPTLELQAAANQPAPVALMPALDPMVLVNGQPNLDKVNAYRAGVDQPSAATLANAGTAAYCQNLLNQGLPRILNDRGFTRQQPSPEANVAPNLFLFLAQRFQATWTNLTCQAQTGLQNPVTTKLNDDGAVLDATINLHPAAAPPGAAPKPTGGGRRAE